MERDVETHRGQGFLRAPGAWNRFWHLPRYLQGVKLRGERWRKQPAKDAERMRKLAPYLGATGAAKWLVEEYRRQPVRAGAGHVGAGLGGEAG